MSYYEDKEKGDVGERDVLKWISQRYPNAYIDNIGKANSDWDIFIPETNEGIEVKMDYKSKITGNLVVEVEFDDKLSALSVTKSKYWVFITGYEYIWITPIEIYRYLEQHPEYCRIRFKAKGDNKHKKAYLLRLHLIKEHVKNNLLKKNGCWVSEIPEKNILYYDNYIKYYSVDDDDVI